MKSADLILVGGFLGSGKTTLLRQASGHLLRRGRRVGLITNDQAVDLVDTETLRQAGLTVEEIAGGCFCCRFSDLVQASDRLVDEIGADILIGEPVGSCTDISATVLQPIKDLLSDRLRLLPFTVLVDPSRLHELLDPRMRSPLHPSARYIIRKQIEEADIIAVNKTDLLPADELDDLLSRAAEEFPNTPIIRISALTGQGVDEWLGMLRRDEPVGHRITEVDYDVYAEGEAVLGWLNATVTLASDAPADWKAFSTDFLRTLQRDLQSQAAEIAHVKLLVTASDTRLAANLTRSDSEVTVTGIAEGDSREAAMIVNARVQTSPDALRSAVERAMTTAAGAGIRATVTDIQCLSPGRPQPTHRYAAVAQDDATK